MSTAVISVPGTVTKNSLLHLWFGRINMKANKRICIYPKDVQLITGKSERYGRTILNKIRKETGKKTNQFITIHEFSTYTGIPLIDIERFITN
ncbi:MAG: hypothetical protein ACK50Y_06960 [Flavobacteriia bacterium]